MKYLLLILLMPLSLAVSAAYDLTTEYDEDEDTLPYVQIKYVTDFSQLAEEARSKGKIILLEISASDCEYCDMLEEEFIKPMLRNDDYTDNVLIRKIDIDSYYKMSDFSGDNTTPDKFSRHRKVQLTPTLLFLDGNGNEVSQRILGINSLELYGGYLDDALKTGLQKIRLQ
jgi:thioredoxin-related protein